MKRTLEHVWSPQLRNRRHVDVYLPPSYSGGRGRYPVIYMQDGQNLSDPETAFAGTWELETTLDRLADRGIEPIIVGVHNAGEARLAEYSPFPDRQARRRRRGCVSRVSRRAAEAAHRSAVPNEDRSRCHGDSRVVDGRTREPVRVLPLSIGVRARGRDEPVDSGSARERCWISSKRRERRRAGFISTSARTKVSARCATHARLGRLLVRKGFTRPKRGAARSAPRSGTAKLALQYVEDPGGRHQEASWARRLGGALEFLLAP